MVGGVGGGRRMVGRKDDGQRGQEREGRRNVRARLVERRTRYACTLIFAYI